MRTITEREILLIGRRLNNQKDLKEVQELYDTATEEGLLVTPSQAKKGFNWLWNLYKSPTGKERKNNPYGYREMGALDNGLSYFTYDGHIDAGNAYRSYYLPILPIMGRIRAHSSTTYQVAILTLSDKGGLYDTVSCNYRRGQNEENT